MPGKKDDKSLADRIRDARDKVQRKETAIRAKRRAKARNPGAFGELKNLGGDVVELAETTVGGGKTDKTISAVGTALDAIDPGDFDDLDGDSDGFNDPFFNNSNGNNEPVDPFAVSGPSNNNPGIDPPGGGSGGGDGGDSGSADDVLLDPADADPLSMDDDDGLF